MNKYSFFLLTGIIFLFFNSCTVFQKQSKNGKNDFVVYPAPPDTARMQYLMSISNSTSLGKRSRFTTFVMGEQEVYSMSKPYGMSMHNGKLYVCDPGINGLEIIDLGKKRYTNFIPGGPGQFKSPLNCFVDQNDYLYVADPGRQDVVVFDSVDNFSYKLSDTGIFKPTDVMVYNDKIWVTNPDNHCLNIYDKNTHALVRHFAQQYGAGDDGFLYSPYNIFITDQKVFITDFGDFKIKEYDFDGNFLSSVGSYGTGIGQFVRPKGIACDRDLNLFVVDAGFENTQTFNKDGQLLMFFGGPYKGPGDMWLPAKVIIDYDNIKYFKKYVNPDFDVKYLIIVSNQYGPDKINIYAAISPKK